MNKNQPLPVNRAFVIQLRDDANPDEGEYRGRVQHMASAQMARFNSLEELQAFMRSVLEAQKLAETQSDQEEEV